MGASIGSKITLQQLGPWPDHGTAMTPGDHYKAARQIGLALASVREIGHWCRTIRAERELWKCAKCLSREFQRDFPNMRNPYVEIPKDV